MKKKLKYVNYVIRKNSFVELSELFQNTEEPTKEISESYGCYKHLSNATTLKDKTIIHIGDGSWCRTGLIFSFYDKCHNISIDPDANKTGRLTKFLEKWNVRNFEFSKGRYEDFDNSQINDCIITMVHAHVTITEVIKKFPNWEFIYTNPCCKRGQQMFSEEFLKNNKHIQLVSYGRDEAILTEKNEYFVYKNLEHKKSFNIFEEHLGI